MVKKVTIVAFYNTSNTWFSKSCFSYISEKN